MLAEYGSSLRLRDTDQRNRHEAKLKEQVTVQEAWKNIFSMSENLLKEQGSHLHFDMRKSLNAKFAWLFWHFDRGHAPFKFDQLSRIWSLEKDVNFDEETRKIQVTAVANKHSPTDASELEIEIGEIQVRLKRYEYYRKDDFIRATLYNGEQEISPIELKDVNFFQSVLEKANP